MGGYQERRLVVTDRWRPLLGVPQIVLEGMSGEAGGIERREG